MLIDILFAFMVAAIFNNLNIISAPNHLEFSSFLNGTATTGDIANCGLSGLLLAQLSCLIISPFSVIWWRILQRVGGKGIDGQINVWDEDNEEFFQTNANNILVRTIECSSLHKGYSTAVARKMRVEPLPTNCVTAEINPQTVAYVRTKMTRLSQDPATNQGRASTTIHRMQSSRPTKCTKGSKGRISGMVR